MNCYEKLLVTGTLTGSKRLFLWILCGKRLKMQQNKYKIYLSVCNIPDQNASKEMK
ncbi:hypothetical protein SAMN02799616_00305 [Paenibacillus sp. UNC499MF]|nr:hypothetical protein SAMN02799616_00305 [Paenibacillus sp. UNC499MF]